MLTLALGVVADIAVMILKIRLEIQFQKNVDCVTDKNN
jgi:hypothetical protein